MTFLRELLAENFIQNERGFEDSCGREAPQARNGSTKAMCVHVDQVVTWSADFGSVLLRQ